MKKIVLKNFQQPNSESQKSLRSLTLQKINKIKKVITSWLRIKKSYMYEKYGEKAVDILAVMACEKLLNYDFKEINELYRNNISEEAYIKGSEHLKATYEELINQRGDRIKRQDSELTSDNTQERFQEEQEFEEKGEYADWYSCNSVDAMDGSKYIGYTRREYEDSRFGTFPIHDDYSDEAWADQNPFE